MSRPQPTDYFEYFSRYINHVPENELMDAFENQQPVIIDFLDSISEEKSLYAYAPGKWTIKEVLQHLIDAERVFTYRAMCIARKEKISLPSFDENNYAANSNANVRSWKSLLEECLHVRRGTTDLFKSFSIEMLDERGSASDKPITVLSLGFILIGHFYHHIMVIKERYNP